MVWKNRQNKFHSGMNHKIDHQTDSKHRQQQRYFQQSQQDEKSNWQPKYQEHKQQHEQQPKRGVLLMKKGTKWYRQRVVNIPKVANSEALTRDIINQLRTEAQNLLKSDIYEYEQQKNKGPSKDDFEWISTVLSSGTVADKLAALTLLIQDSPVHNLRSLETLFRFVNPKGKRECCMAVDNLRDLFIGDLLLPLSTHNKQSQTEHQTLHTFEEILAEVDVKWLLSTNTTLGDRERFLIISHIEDQIRAFYRRFIDQLITIGHDNLEVLKLKSLRTMYDLLAHSSEQESYLLSCMVNKLGDPIAKVASQTSHLLAQLIAKHQREKQSQKKAVIVKEVENLLFRPHIPPRAEYYCLCFLSEIVFTTGLDQDLANRIIQIYLTIFNKCIKKGEINNKIMSTLLTGVSRAFPYSKLETKFLEKYLNTFYRILHYVSPNTGIQTLSLIFNLVNFNESGSLTDRFYSALYRFVTNPIIDQCSKCTLLLNVLFRSIKKDPIVKRVRAFVKRLLQVTMLSSSGFIVGIMVLISETLKQKQGFKMEANILRHAIGDIKQIKSHTKGGDGVNIAFIEMEEKKKTQEDSDDDVEVYYDVDIEDDNTETVVADNNQKILKSVTNENGNIQSSKPSWVFVKPKTGVELSNEEHVQDEQQKAKFASKLTDYDIDARNPLYCNADREEIWELALLTRHFHPTVKLFGEKLLAGELLEYDGNPLDDFTVKRFLDRFVYRNPKQKVVNNKKSEHNVRPSVFARTKSEYKQSALSTSNKDFVELAEDAVPVDEKYIYRYLLQRKSMHLNDDLKNHFGGDDDSDVDSVTSLEFNDLLDNYESTFAADDGDIDFAKNYQQNKGNPRKKTKDKDDEEEEDIEEDDPDFDEEPFDFSDDSNDDMTVDDDDDDIAESFTNGGSSEEDSENYPDLDLGLEAQGVRKLPNAAPFKGKRAFPRITNDIFASADEFAHLLEQNDESDSDFEHANDVSEDSDRKKSGKTMKGKRPIVGRNMRRKKRLRAAARELMDK